MKREKQNKEKKPRKGYLKWLFQMFYKPRATLTKVGAEDVSNKRTPLLFISIMVILAVLIAAPVKTQQLQMGATLPDDFQWWSEQQQQEYLDAQQNKSSPVFMIVFPAATGILGYLVFSLLMASILYLSLTLAGSRAPRMKVGNVVAWAMVPFGIRELVKFFVVGSSKQLVENPGLSNLVDAEAKGFSAFLRGVLGSIDLYWLVFVIFLVIGAILISGLKKSKALVTTIVAVLIMLLLQGVPNLVTSLLGGLSGGGAGFYF
ncbi:MAG: YIP1 family protein [Anaerolineaceae bacterium]|jgi:hypothetical protein